MLNTYKNELFSILKERKVAGADEFLIEEGDGEPSRAFFQLSFNPIPKLSFRAIPSGSSHVFVVSAGRFDPPEHKAGHTGAVPFDKVKQSFVTWIVNEIVAAKRELTAPDYWSEASHLISSETDSGEEFSERQKEQIRGILDDFKQSLIQEFAPTREQLAQISGRILYLREAVDRMNRFDWEGVAMRTMMSIAGDLAMNPDKAGIIVHLFNQAAGSVLKLLGA